MVMILQKICQTIFLSPNFLFFPISCSLLLRHVTKLRERKNNIEIVAVKDFDHFKAIAKSVLTQF